MFSVNVLKGTPEGRREWVVKFWGRIAQNSFIMLVLSPSWNTRAKIEFPNCWRNGIISNELDTECELRNLLVPYANLADISQPDVTAMNGAALISVARSRSVFIRSYSNVILKSACALKRTSSVVERFLEAVLLRSSNNFDSIYLYNAIKGNSLTDWLFDINYEPLPDVQHPSTIYLNERTWSQTFRIFAIT